MPLNFSDSRYLGLRHGSRELEVWNDLTSGVPAAFFENPGAIEAGKAIARLQGLADGVVAPSTLHLFWDWFGTLNPQRNFVFADQHLYRVGAWGVERAAGRGVPTVRFAHHSPRSLAVFLDKKQRNNCRPIVVTDGWCPLCGKAAPLREYLTLLEPLGGWLVLDDTQALGVLGSGGLLRFFNISSDRVISISSLAKAFGVPLATLCGPKEAVETFRTISETRVYASPASTVAIRAAQFALKMNTIHGEALRKKLQRNIRLFKNSLSDGGVLTGGGPFPVQFLKNTSGEAARELHKHLWQRGLRTVLSKDHDGMPLLCFLLNDRQTEAQIEQACEVAISSLGRLAGYGPGVVSKQFSI
jgi:8-amino-7-oxononanoate synthase